MLIHQAKGFQMRLLIIITMAYPAVHNKGHGGTHNPPRMFFGCLFSSFNG